MEGEGALLKVTGFGGSQTTKGQEWGQKAGEEVVASCSGERSCSGWETERYMLT